MVEKTKESGYEKSYTYAGTEYNNIDEYLDAQSSARKKLADLFNNKKPSVKPEGNINNFITSLSQMASDTAIRLLSTKIDTIDNNISSIVSNVRDLTTRVFGAEGFISKLSTGLEEVTTSMFSWVGLHFKLEETVNQNTDDLNQLRKMEIKTKNAVNENDNSLDSGISQEDSKNPTENSDNTKAKTCTNTGESDDSYFAHELHKSINPDDANKYTKIMLPSGKDIYIENICECPEGYVSYSSTYETQTIPNSGCILSSTQCEYSDLENGVSFSGGLTNCNQQEIVD